MIKQVLLEGKPAYKIKAVQIAQTPRAILFDCEGDDIWIPKSVCKPVPQDETVVILDWWYNKNME